jgi:GH15 family glucan-1,4-alpha-glucosidase
MKKIYQPIENYGIIGDLHTTALVSLKGSIDFMCFSRYDSPTIFASILDKDIGGNFSIEPILEDISFKQIYIPETAILLTRFFSDDGIAELTDFMPITNGNYNCTLIRKIKTIRGKINYRMHCKPGFNYASEKHRVEKINNSLVFIADSGNSFTLTASVPLKIKEHDGYAEFFLHESEEATFLMEENATVFSSIENFTHFVNDRYNVTLEFWLKWISKSLYRGRWRESVHRSAITLKLLTSIEFGAPVAAATFGLPEALGGTRNWDYRFTWIRDAAFSMYAFLRLGFMEEAHAFINWIEKRVLEGRLQLIYSIDGNSHLEEIILTHLEGYKKSKPVRIGNEAYMQTQLDIYGELIDTIYLYNKDGGAITFHFWKNIEKLIINVIKCWKLPDHGIWEVRDKKYEFLHSRMMCWVALDRAIKIAQSRSFPYPFTEWHTVRDEIYEDIYFNFWNEEKKSFVQYKGGNTIDASVLLMSLMRILSPAEEHWKSTLRAVEKELRTDVLIYRNHDNPHFHNRAGGIEGTFTMCSFWYVECLAKAGQTRKASEYFSKILGYSNHLGLFSEEIGLKGEHLGNFPQAFTHLGLISAALELDRDLE